MMKVYVINEVVDNEYGCVSAIKVFADKDKAQKWVDENQVMHYPWYCEDDEGEPMYSIQEFVVE